MKLMEVLDNYPSTIDEDRSGLDILSRKRIEFNHHHRHQQQQHQDYHHTDHEHSHDNDDDDDDDDDNNNMPKEDSLNLQVEVSMEKMNLHIQDSSLTDLSVTVACGVHNDRNKDYKDSEDKSSTSSSIDYNKNDSSDDSNDSINITTHNDLITHHNSDDSIYRNSNHHHRDNDDDDNDNDTTNNNSYLYKFLNQCNEVNYDTDTYWKLVNTITYRLTRKNIMNTVITDMIAPLLQYFYTLSDHDDNNHDDDNYHNDHSNDDNSNHDIMTSYVTRQNQLLDHRHQQLYHLFLEKIITHNNNNNSSSCCGGRMNQKSRQRYLKFVKAYINDAVGASNHSTNSN